MRTAGAQAVCNFRFVAQARRTNVKNHAAAVFPRVVSFETKQEQK
jgi:hypothetical protein